MSNRNKIEFYEDQAKEWRWRITASNGEIVGASSEGFKALGDAEKNLELVGEAIVHDPDVNEDKVSELTRI